MIGYILYRKGIIRKRGISPTSVRSDNPALPSSLVQNVRYEIQLFETKTKMFKAEPLPDIQKMSDEINEYVEDKVSIYSRRGEFYDIEFINLNWAVLVAIKHWTVDDVE